MYFDSLPSNFGQYYLHYSIHFVLPGLDMGKLLFRDGVPAFRHREYSSMDLTPGHLALAPCTILSLAIYKHK